MHFELHRVDQRINQLKARNINICTLLGINDTETVNASIKNDCQYEVKAECLKKLKAACIMDPFTLDCYKPECTLLELTPDNWMQEIETFRPDFLFIESAWQGKDKLWYHKIDRCSKEYFELTSYCKNKKIPIIFWNKEDPVYTDTFMAAARMADFVFTTDIDSIEKYKESLRHDRVFHLHFAAQPRIHNPIEKFERKDKFCFAGAYYHRYSERTRVFDEFAKYFMDTKGFDIYDRNYHRSLPEYAFPRCYDALILGRLDTDEIDVAYKGYRYGVNMNSISQSQTMFARRTFELIGSNTVTIGNYSRGIKNYFGDLTISANEAATLKNNLAQYCSDEETYRKYRLLGLRKVLTEHLYEDRLNYIVKKVFGVELKASMPFITVLGFPHNEKELERIKACFNQQRYHNKKLYLVTETGKKPEENNVFILTPKQAEEFPVKSLSDNYITVFDPCDYYGRNYLLDLVLTTRYGNFDGIGKAAYYTADGEEIALRGKNYSYKRVPYLDLEQSIQKTSIFSDKVLSEIKNVKSAENRYFFSADEFNYCKNYTGSTCDKVDDLFIADQGLAMKDITAVSEKIKTQIRNAAETVINGARVADSKENTLIRDISFEVKDEKLIIEGHIQENTHQYIYMDDFFEVDPFRRDGKITVCFNGIGDLDCIGVCIFYDGKKNKLTPVFTPVNQLLEANVPTMAKYFKLAIRAKEQGKFILHNIVINAQSTPNRKSCFLSRSGILVLTNQYPAADNLYRNMFVHKRLTEYKKDGFNCDVMRMNIYAKNIMREFEGINIIEGQGDTLSSLLETGSIYTVCVHFLDQQMWSVLKNFADKVRIIVWIHGSEVQPWWRRAYNFETTSELIKGKEESATRMQLWKEVFLKVDEYSIHFVFVSQYLAKEVMEDYHIQLSQKHYSIIHNCIDTELFDYMEKSPEQRFNILTIKAFANRKYANDITTKAIVELSKNKIFSSLQFNIYGDGERFDQDNAPLKKFKNVHLHRGFLKQEEISKLHKNHGVFIASTRWDSQGVSRDEAMASGLVPIANNVSAIPEFVDDQCGMLIPAEDYKALSDAIIRLCADPEFFKILSENAALRIRSQTARAFTIEKEIRLIQCRS